MSIGVFFTLRTIIILFAAGALWVDGRRILAGLTVLTVLL